MLRLYCISPIYDNLTPISPLSWFFSEGSIHDKTMSSDSYSFKTGLMPTPPQMSNDECLLPHSRSEVAGQWSRKPDTPLNEMV